MSQTELNTWLISNSQLYFADSILSKNLELNMYSLFDLSNLLQSILLADKIITLPGSSEKNDTAEMLREKGILEELVIEKDISEIVSDVKYTWDTDSIVVQNKDKFADILCHIFPIEKEIADNAVSKANEWASSRYRTPHWHETKKFVMQTVKTEDLTKMIGIGNFTKSYNSYPIEDIVTETFVRAILYFMIASKRKLNYYPDSIRSPISAYLNVLLEQTVYKFVRNLSLEIDGKIAEQYGPIYERTGFTRTEITIPSSFSTIIASCRNRGELIDKTLELRDSKDLKKCRRWLAEFEESAKNLNTKKFNRMSKQITLLENPVKYDMDSLIISSIPSFTDLVNPNITKSTAKGVTAGMGLGVGKLIEHLRTRNLIFYRKLSRQFDKVVSVRDHVERVFESRLSNEDIEILRRLNDSLKDYLKPTNHLSQEQQLQPTSSFSIAYELTKLAKLKGRGVISESEFQQMKQNLIRKM